jgi:hypothetical protein
LRIPEFILANTETSNMSGRTFLYHAHGSALGGTITHPFKAELDSHAATSLPIVGGYASAKAENYHFKELISYKSATTYISGVRTADGVHSTVCTCTIEGLNILDVVTADAIIGRLSSKHLGTGEPEIIPLGSAYVNLKIAGRPVEVDLDHDLFSLNPTYTALLNHLQAQGSGTNAGASKATPRRARYEWGGSSDQIPPSIEKGMLIPPAVGWQQANGVLHTSLAKQVRLVGANNSAELPYAYAFYVPQVGSIYLAELFVSADTKGLNMLRIELGSPVGGSVAAAAPTTNGEWFP